MSRSTRNRVGSSTILAKIWHNVEAVTRAAWTAPGLARADIAAVGITNQRETTLLWDAKTGDRSTTRSSGTTPGRPVGPRVGRRDADRLRDRCGLPFATYFSAPKIRWLLDRDPELRKRAEGGDVLFGTVDTWLIWQLTGCTPPMSPTPAAPC